MIVDAACSILGVLNTLNTEWSYLCLRNDIFHRLLHFGRVYPSDSLGTSHISIRSLSNSLALLSLDMSSLRHYGAFEGILFDSSMLGLIAVAIIVTRKIEAYRSAPLDGLGRGTVSDPMLALQSAPYG